MGMLESIPMTPTRDCPACGNPLPVDAPAGLCPRCLLAGGFATRVTREARTLAKLNHPGIVHVYDFGRAGDHFFIVMEYVEGVNLRQAERSGKMSPAEALAVVPQICAALQFAHEAGIVHR